MKTPFLALSTIAISMTASAGTYQCYSEHKGPRCGSHVAAATSCLDETGKFGHWNGSRVVPLYWDCAIKPQNEGATNPEGDVDILCPDAYLGVPCENIGVDPLPGFCYNAADNYLYAPRLDDEGRFHGELRKVGPCEKNHLSSIPDGMIQQSSL